MSPVRNWPSIHSVLQLDSAKGNGLIQCQPSTIPSSDSTFKSSETDTSFSLTKLEKLDSVKAISAKDVIVAIMGPAGSGKSTFIQAATNSNFGEVNHNLRPQHCKISVCRVEFDDAIRFVLVDTPGLSDDSKKTCAEKVEFISRWLQTLSAKKLEIAGILYLHKIDLDRMDLDTEKCLVAFKRFLADSKLRSQVILTTTMWPTPTLGPDASYESELKEKQIEFEEQYWANIIKGGDHAQEFRGTHTSAWNILDQILVPATSRMQGKVLEVKQRLNDLSERVGDAVTSEGTVGMLVDKQEDLLKRIEDIAILDPSTARLHFPELIDLLQQGESALKELTGHGPLWRQLLGVVQGVKKHAVRGKLGVRDDGLPAKRLLFI